MRITALQDTRVGTKRVKKNETIELPDKLAAAFVKLKTFREAGAIKAPIAKAPELKAGSNQTYKTRQVKAEE